VLILRGLSLLAVAGLLAAPLSAAPGVQGGAMVAGAYVGVLEPGQQDRYPMQLPPDLCALASGISTVYLLVPAAGPDDDIVLWTYEEDALGRLGPVAHPVAGTPPMASGRTHAPYLGCPSFAVEARTAAGPVAYVALACNVGGCPYPVPLVGGAP
jgi:hypothetical protein